MVGQNFSLSPGIPLAKVSILNCFLNGKAPNLLSHSVFLGGINSNHNLIAQEVFPNLFARTGITCEKIPCYMRDSACRWFIVLKAKVFWGSVKHF